MNDLIKRQTISIMVENYNKALSEIDQCFELLKNAQKRIEIYFNHQHSFYNFPSIEKTKLELKQTCWRKIMDISQIRNFLSTQREQEIMKSIDENTIPELTEEYLTNFLKGFYNNLNTLLDEAVFEAFKILTPDKYWNKEYKTNSPFKIKNKVILANFLDNSWGLRISYRREQNLRVIDNAFSLLDGKGPIKYPGDLVTQIKTTLDNNEKYLETKYYKIKLYLNGNIHLEFKRLDLVKQINYIGGKYSNQLNKAS